MRISIIVPVYNNARDLAKCLAGIAASGSPNTEVLVVNDASIDDSASIAQRAGVQVIRLGKNSGPAAARNCGASQARGDVLFFVDSDVVLAPDAVQRVASVFETQPEVAAVFGSYDAFPRARGLVSRYRNLLHHFVHQNGHSEASTFWAGCGAIRRSVFEQVGGFDEKRFPRASIEDIELGYRLRQSGHRILLDKMLQGTHLKQWNLFSLIRTDITCRAIPWSRLILETKEAPDDLNLQWGQRTSFVLVVLACMFLALAVLRPQLLAVSAAALFGVAILNRVLYTFFFRRHGIFFAAACIPLHLLYYLYSGFSYLYVWTDFQLKKAASVRALSVLRGERQGVKPENP